MIRREVVRLTANASGSASSTTNRLYGTIERVHINYGTASGNTVLSVKTSEAPLETIYSKSTSNTDVVVVPMKVAQNNAGADQSAGDNRLVKYVVDEPLTVSVTDMDSGDDVTVKIVYDGTESPS